MNATNILKTMSKGVVRSLIYRFPPVYISPAGLHLWFNAILSTQQVDGVVVEIGCYLGATAALSSKFLKESGSDRQYIVIDTFGGFVDGQFDNEVKLGGAPDLRYHFSRNSPQLARWVMDKHGGADVKMVVGDVTTLPEDQLPDKISACLIDIDLAEPIYEALLRVYPRLCPGGIVVIDDCDKSTLYKARLGYERFMQEQGLQSEIQFGKGIVRKSL